MYKIITIIDNNESQSIDWPTVPRVGDFVTTDDGSFEVLQVEHMFHRGRDSPEGSISLHLKAEKKKRQDVSMIL